MTLTDKFKHFIMKCRCTLTQKYYTTHQMKSIFFKFLPPILFYWTQWKFHNSATNSFKMPPGFLWHQSPGNTITSSAYRLAIHPTSLYAHTT